MHCPSKVPQKVGCMHLQTGCEVVLEVLVEDVEDGEQQVVLVVEDVEDVDSGLGVDELLLLVLEVVGKPQVFRVSAQLCEASTHENLQAPTQPRIPYPPVPPVSSGRGKVVVVVVVEIHQSSISPIPRVSVALILAPAGTASFGLKTVTRQGRSSVTGSAG